MNKKIWFFVGIAVIIGVGIYFAYPFLKGLMPAFWPAEKVEEGEKTAEDLGLKVADGFSLSVFARNLNGPRVMIEDGLGNIIVSLTSGNQVAVLTDEDKNGVANNINMILIDRKSPHGLALKCASESDCHLYVGETDGVYVFDYNRTTFYANNPRKIINLDSGGRHFTRTLQFLPAPQDNRLLISVGSSCDVCEEENSQRASILVADINLDESGNPEASNLKTFSRGLRNSVYLTVNPVTNEVWATEMGRDFLGDNLPPDEINIIKEGEDYGWPICYGQNVHDTDFDKNVYVRDPCADKTPAHIEIQAHSAPLGLAFFPDATSLLVSYHGSWNRSEPTGYKVVRYRLGSDGNPIGSPEDFISGWLDESGTAWGRPTGILFSEGTIYLADDKAGLIYRITY